VSYGLFEDFHKIKLPSKNFTDTYKLYQTIKSENVPVFIINARKWEDYIPKIYFNYVGNKYQYGSQVISALGGEVDLSDGINRLEKFIKFNPYGLIILAQHNSCDPSIFKKIFREHHIRIIKSGQECIWILQNISSINEVKYIFKRIKFPSDIFNNN